MLPGVTIDYVIRGNLECGKLINEWFKIHDGLINEQKVLNVSLRRWIKTDPCLRLRLIVNLQQ